MFCVRSYLGPRETTPVGDDLDYEHAGAVLLDNAGLGDPPHADIFRFELCGSPPRRAPAGSHSKSAFKGSCPVFCIRCVSPGDGEGKYIRAIDDGPGPLFFACGKTSRRAAEFCFLPAARSDHFEMIYLDPRGIQERGYPMGVIGDCLGQYDDCGGPPLQVVMFPVLPDEFCPDAARLEVAAQRTSDKEKLELQNAEAAAAALVTPELLARVLAQRPAPRDAVSAAGGAAGAAAGEDARTANARRKRARQRYWRLVLRDLRVSAMTPDDSHRYQWLSHESVPDWEEMPCEDWEYGFGMEYERDLRFVKEAFTRACKALITQHVADSRHRQAQRQEGMSSETRAGEKQADEGDAEPEKRCGGPIELRRELSGEGKALVQRALSGAQGGDGDGGMIGHAGLLVVNEADLKGKMTRMVIIGDIHGCFDELQDLLNAPPCSFAEDPANIESTLIVLVGDLVNKGPKSVEVVEWARAQSAAGRLLAVRGNHDDMALAAIVARSSQEVEAATGSNVVAGTANAKTLRKQLAVARVRAKTGKEGSQEERIARLEAELNDLAENAAEGKQTVAQHSVAKGTFAWTEDLSPEGRAWLASLPYIIHFPWLNMIVVHAGLRVGIPLEAQSRDDAVNLRDVGTIPWAKVWSSSSSSSSSSFSSSSLVDGKALAARQQSLERSRPHVFFGHDAPRGIQQEALATGLDSACVNGGSLSAWYVEACGAGEDGAAAGGAGGAGDAYSDYAAESNGGGLKSWKEGGRIISAKARECYSPAKWASQGILVRQQQRE